MHWTGSRQSYDPADILGRWYAYGSHPARDRGLVRRDVDAWCAAQGTTPTAFIDERREVPEYGYDAGIAASMLKQFVAEVADGTIDPATARYTYKTEAD